MLNEPGVERLTDAGILDLQARLLRLGDSALRLPELEGLIAAMLVGPELVPPHDWLPTVFCADHDSPGHEPHERDGEETLALIGLIMARYNDVARALLAGRGEYRAIFDIDEQTDEPIWFPWLEGFQIGMEFCTQSWIDLQDTRDRNVTIAFGTIGLLVMAMDAAMEDGEAGPDVIAHDAADALQEAVEVLYAHRTGRPTWKVDTPLRPHRHGKVGRNDPCFCGSGRKYKKCCGAG